MKIVQVLNSIISNKEKIGDVIRKGREYYFLYDKKYKWSIIKAEKSDDYYIHFYPNKSISLEQIVDIQDWENFNELVTYSTDDIKTKEAFETFRELYQIVSEKVFGIDDIFDEIILGF